MKNYDEIVREYLEQCANQKRLNPKTIRAYMTDLKQLGCRNARDLRPDSVKRIKNKKPEDHGIHNHRFL